MSRKAIGALSLAAVLALGSAAGRAQDAPGGGPTSVAISDEGQEVYEQICQACHMADAKGGGGAGASIPALAGNAKLADKDYILGMVINGRGGMPSLTDMLTPRQIAAVTTYVRGHFNAYPDPVTEADVKRVAGTSTASPKDCATC